MDNYFYTTQKLENPRVHNVKQFQYLHQALNSLENETGTVYQYHFARGWELGCGVIFENGKPIDFVYER